MRRFKLPQFETRFADARPGTYDADARTVEAVLSTGAAVRRPYGTERLSLDPGAVVLTRHLNGGIPLLDSHNQYGIDNALGRIESVWLANRQLLGRIKFNDTDRGRQAEGMVSRGEITGISIGYRVDEWQVTDADGRVIDPERERLYPDDADLTFTATLWELLEGSLVTVPADPSASVRGISIAAGFNAAAVRRRMRMQLHTVLAGVKL